MLNERDYVVKRFICILFVLCFLPIGVFADYDLSAMSFDELKALQLQIINEYVSRPEWKETKIPSGQWEVGKDIPAGEYRITLPKDGAAHMKITYTKENSKREETVIDWYAFNDTDYLGKMILIDGYIVMISAGSVILSPVIPLEL